MRQITQVLVAMLLLPAAGALAQEGGQEATMMGDSLVAMFLKGGIFMWPILACSIVSLAFALERAVGLRMAVIFPQQLLADVKASIREGKVEQAVRQCAESGSPFGKLLYACLNRADTPGFEMETALEETGSRVLYDLRKNIKPLGIVADVSPLLGLMGTVQGMIMAFELVAKSGAMGRADKLAESIAVALLTTAFGLVVAIPSVIGYHYFRSKAENLLRAMEDACLVVMDDLRKGRKIL